MLQLCVIVFVSSLSLFSCDKGSCPPTLSVDICDPTCGLSHPCNTTQLCCPTACGGAMCVDPMTERHVVTLEKPGECPEYPHGLRRLRLSSDSQVLSEQKWSPNLPAT